MLTSAAVLDARFTVTRFREGYDQDEVTAFLARAAAALAAWEAGAGAPDLAGDDVVAQRFRPTKFDNGFDQDEVDDLLDRIGVALREHAAAAHAAEAAAASAAASAASTTEATAAPVAPPPALVRASAITDAGFPTRRFGHGFSPSGVDGFLAAVRSVIADYERPGMLDPAPALSAADVVNVRFTPTWWRSGYDQDEVAAYLTRIIETLHYYEQR